MYTGGVYLLNKVKNILIVDKLNVTPINLFFSVFFLFHLEHMLKRTKKHLSFKHVFFWLKK
jgi:hypothetical protein